MTKKKPTKLFVVTSCVECPNSTTERTRGAGYALDRMCTAVKGGRMIVGYVEWPSEDAQPGVFPKWCPLKEGPKK